MSNKTNGQLAYEAYLAVSDGKSLVSGAPLPTWEECDAKIQVAWEAGGRAVAEAVSAPLVAELTVSRQGQAERDEELARLFNELGLKAGGFKEAQLAVQELQRAAKAKGAKQIKFKRGAISFKRTGRTLELRFAETGPEGEEVLAQVEKLLETAGLGDH